MSPTEHYGLDICHQLPSQKKMRDMTDSDPDCDLNLVWLSFGVLSADASMHYKVVQQKFKNWWEYIRLAKAVSEKPNKTE